MDAVRYAHLLQGKRAKGRIIIPSFICVVHRDKDCLTHLEIVVVGATDDGEAGHRFKLAPSLIEYKIKTV